VDKILKRRQTADGQEELYVSYLHYPPKLIINKIANL